MDERKIFYCAAIIVGLLLPLQLAFGASAPVKVRSTSLEELVHHALLLRQR